MKSATSKPKCYNCKFASSAFKIAGKTHHQCCHPKHNEGFEKGTLSPWMWADCAAIASACARVDVLCDGLPRGAVACEAPAGRGNSVGFRRNCIQWHITYLVYMTLLNFTH